MTSIVRGCHSFNQIIENWILALSPIALAAKFIKTSFKMLWATTRQGFLNYAFTCANRLKIAP
jgi:hypothetical protein